MASPAIEENIVDQQIEKEIMEGAAPDAVHGDEMTNRVVYLQKELDKLRFKAIKARAEQESLDPCYKINEFYTNNVNVDRLSNLTKKRTQGFLSYNTLHDALKGSQAVKALKAGFELLQEKDGDSEEGEDIRLEPEEREYVEGLMSEENELSKSLIAKSDVILHQDVEMIQLRKSHAENLCRISELWTKLQETKDNKLGDNDKPLLEQEAKVNQFRLMIQRLMMGENNLGQIFDDQTNKRFKDMFIKCGYEPEELRKQLSTESDTNISDHLTPQDQSSPGKRKSR